MTVTDQPSTTPITAYRGGPGAQDQARRDVGQRELSPRVVDELVGALGGVLVDAVDIQRHQRVLDVAAGTGSSAYSAARLAWAPARSPPT